MITNFSLWEKNSRATTTAAGVAIG